MEGISEEEKERLRQEQEDLNEFKFCYKEVSPDFSYLMEMEKNEENFNMFFDMFIMFMKGCARPQHLEREIISNILGFGKRGWFEHDLRAMLNWSEAVLAIEA